MTTEQIVQSIIDPLWSIKSYGGTISDGVSRFPRSSNGFHYFETETGKAIEPMHVPLDVRFELEPQAYEQCGWNWEAKKKLLIDIVDNLEEII